MRGAFARAVGALTVMLMVACSVFVIMQSFQIVRALCHHLGDQHGGAHSAGLCRHAALLVGFSMMLLAVIVRLRNYITGRFD